MVNLDIAEVVNSLKTLLQNKFHDGGQISTGKLLESEGKTIQNDCPKCDAEDITGRTGLCWNWLTGRCTRGGSCVHVHAHPRELPQKLVSEFATLIAPGIAKKIEQVEALPNIKRARITMS